MKSLLDEVVVWGGDSAQGGECVGPRARRNRGSLWLRFRRRVSPGFRLLVWLETQVGSKRHRARGNFVE